MSRDLNWYMNEAKEKNNIKSDRKLAIELGVSNVGLWRNPYRPAIPEAQIVLKLAKLAGVPEEIALIDRDIWIAEFKAPETIPYYKKILKQFPKYAASILTVMAFHFSDIDGGNSGLMTGKQYQETSLTATIQAFLGDKHDAHDIYYANILCFLMSLLSFKNWGRFLRPRFPQFAN